MAALTTSNLSLVIAGRTLCEDLSVAMNGGENWAILGPNGAGKTTLLHCLAGLRAPADGELRLNGRPLAGLAPRERARALAVLFQDYEIAFPGTVMDCVLTGRHPRLSRWQWEGEEDRRRARAALAEVGMAEFAERALATLSGGERRRVEIATLLAQDAEICLMDEPTNHLDLRHQGHVLSRLSARTRDTRNLNVWVLHDVNLALRYASHGILLFGDGAWRQGRLADIVDAETLTHLYGCPIRVLRDGGERFYVSQ